MCDSSSEREHRDHRSNSGFWILVIFVFLPMGYVLSPPWVALMLGPNYYEVPWFESLYAPLIYLDRNIEVLSTFYIWYFGLITGH